MRMLLLAAAAAVTVAGSAQAAVRFDVTGTLTIGGAAAGTLTGTFTTDDSLSTVTDYNLVASGNGAEAGFTFSPGTAFVSASTLPSQYFRLDSPGLTQELQIFFDGGLSATGGTIRASSSYESQPNTGTRMLGGTVTRAVDAVPEPAAWLTMMTGMATVGAALRRRARVGDATRSGAGAPA